MTKICKLCNKEYKTLRGISVCPECFVESMSNSKPTTTEWENYINRWENEPSQIRSELPLLLAQREAEARKQLLDEIQEYCNGIESEDGRLIVLKFRGEERKKNDR